MDELRPGLLRVTFDLPLGIDHVHCYLLRSSDGTWTLVDAGLGVADPELLAAGDRVDGWEVLHLPGHADGHIALLKDGVLVAGDTILGRITPTVGLYQQSRPDPLGDYLSSLERIAELGAAVAFAGHEDPIADPETRGHELQAHHEERMGAALRALADEPRPAYEASLELFPSELVASHRRFAVAETLAHLERLGIEGQARREEADGLVVYRR